MNERLKELAVQAGIDAKEIRDDESLTLYAFEEFDLERFAELVRQDVNERYARNIYEMILGAIADEREACAQLCTEMHNNQTNQCLYDPWDCAEAIRARGNRTKTSKDLCDND